MQKIEKEAVVAELAERLRSADSLIVADYRGLTNAQLETLRARLREHGAQLKIVKNTLTRRAATEAGSELLLALLEGPTAIAFVESEGDPIAVAKALSDTARETRVLTVRGGVMTGRAITDADVEELAKLPPTEVVKSQLVGVIIAPLTQLLGLLTAPVRDLIGLIDARVEQLGEGASADAEGASAGAESPSEEPLAVVETGEAGEEGASADAEGASAGAESPTSEEPRGDSETAG